MPIKGGGVREDTAAINFQATAVTKCESGVGENHTGDRRVVSNDQPRLTLVVRDGESGDEVRNTEVENVGVTTGKIIR